MTVQMLLTELNKLTTEHPEYLSKEILIVDHVGNEIGIVKDAMSTSHWPYFVIYTEENQ